MSEMTKLSGYVDKLSKLLQSMNTLTDKMQTNSINLLKKNAEKGKNAIENLDEKIENSKTPNIFVSLFSKFLSLFSKKDISKKLSEETLFESTTEKQQVIIETKESLISKANDAKSFMDNKNEININNKGKGVEIL